MNIWSMDRDGKNAKQHTFSSGWDITTLAMHDANIVYQKGADIGLFNINTNEDKTLDISITSDFEQRAPRWIQNGHEQISYWEISPNGKLVALISRGRLFVTPANGSRWVEISRKSGIRYKAVAFIDDKTVAYLSDESGEYEIWKAPADGSGAPTQLTKNAKVLITGFLVSPSGKYIAITDKDWRLTLFNTIDGTTKLLEQNEHNYLIHHGIKLMHTNPNCQMVCGRKTIKVSRYQYASTRTTLRQYHQALHARSERAICISIHPTRWLERRNPSRRKQQCHR